MKTLILKLTQAGTVISLLAFGSAVTPCTEGANKTWDGGGADNFWQSGGNWDANTPPSANDVLSFTGTTRLNSTNNLTAGTVFNRINFVSPAGAFTLSGNQISLGGDITDNQTLVPQTINLPLTLNATRNVDVASDALLTISGVISGTGVGITKAGGGVLALTAVNTFSGPASVLAGTLSVASDSNLGTVPGVPTPGNVVLNGGALRTTANLSLSVNRGIAVGPTTGSGTGTLSVNSGTTLTYDGVIANNAGTGGLIKNGFGNLSLSRANTYSGPTAVKVGTLTLDFTKANSPVNNIINTSSALSLGGENAGFGALNYAQLNLLGKANATNSQSFNGTHVTFASSVILATNGASGAANLALGALDHDPGGTLTILTPALSGRGNITTATTNVNGILGGWATIGDGSVVTISGNVIVLGTNFASVDASGNIGNFTGYRALANGEKLHNLSAAGTNLFIGPSVTGDMLVNDDGAGTVTDVNAIHWRRTDNNVTLRVGINNTLRLGKYGAIFKSDTTAGLTWLIGQTAAGANGPDQDVGTLTAGGADNTPGEIIVHANSTSSSSGTVIIDCKITDNGTGPVTFVKTGAGSMKLRGHNTHSGGTYLLQGRVQFVGGEGGVGTGNADAGGTGPIYILPGCYLFPSGTGPTTPVTNAVFIAGNGTAGEPLGAIRTSANWLFNGPWTLIGDTTIGGNGGASGAIGAKLSGPFNLTLCSGATVQGTVCLTNSGNDWSGTTTMQNRSGQSDTFLSGNSEIIPHGFGKGNVVFLGQTGGTITWNLNGFSETINGLSSSGNAPSGVILNNGPTPSTLTVGDYDQSATFGGAINNGSGTVALTKIGAGVETLTGNNNYTGDTTVNGGTLELSGAGSIASSANILVNSGGTLDVSGATGGFSSAGPVNVNGGTLVVRSAGSPGMASLSLANARVRLSTLGGTNVVATALSLGGATNLIDIISVGFITSYPTQFTVLKYSGAISGSFNLGLGAVPSPTTIGFVSNNTANSSVDLVLLDGPKPLTWTGTKGRDWDIVSTTNWLAFGITPIGYLDADSAIFRDGASTNVVNLTTLLQPGSVIVSNQTLNYTFVGSGSLSGFGGLLKDGPGTLTLANLGLSDFKGGVTVSNGTLALATDQAISGGATLGPSGILQVGTNGPSGTLPSGTIVNDGTLVLNRSDDFVTTSLISGAGVVRKVNANAATLGAVSADYSGLILVAQGTLKAGGALGGATATTIVSNAATLDVNGQNLNATTVRVRGAGVGGNGAIVNSGADQINALGNVILEANTTFGGTGRWDLRGGAATLSTEGGAYTLTKTGTNQFSLVGVTVDGALANLNVQQGIFSVETSTGELGDVTRPLTVASGATLQLFGTTFSYAKPIVLNGDGVAPTLNIGSGAANTLAGPLTLNGNCLFNLAGNTALSLIGTVSGSGQMIKTGAGTNILLGTITYSGATTVSNGTLLVNSPKGPAGGITVRSGTLGGYSSLAEPVVIGANGVLAPGDPSVSTVTLVLSNTLTLGGTLQVDVLKSGGQFQNDGITNLTALTLGGRLQVNVDTNGEALANGDAIKLLSFNTASGNVSEIVPATPGAGLFWDKSKLPVDGTLRVTNTSPEPLKIGTVAVSGTNVVMTGTGGTAGASFYVLSTTNVALPMNSWERAQTNVFDANGNFSVTNSVQAGVPQNYYRLQLP